ncbi:MAG: CYTH domain-containing protein [Pseudomonadota bacterium]
MALEIERKYLVAGPFPEDPSAKTLVQGYIAREDGRTVRVRFDGTSYKLTIKGKSEGIARHEFEWTLEEAEGQALLHGLCTIKIEKVRHKVPHAGFIWEVDVFSGDNAGLIVAEVELPSAEASFEIPSWAAREVSDDARFFNAALLDTPFVTWGVAYEDLLKG